MPRYVALLRGVSPQYAKMAELRACFEKLGFEDVKTVLSSGNVIFSGADIPLAELTELIESGMDKHLPRSFPAIIRKQNDLIALLDTDPYAAFDVSPEAKKVVTFLREPLEEDIALPIELHDARILSVKGKEVFTAYIPGEHGPVFMKLIKKTLGTGVTTRTWNTIKKCALK